MKTNQLLLLLYTDVQNGWEVRSRAYQNPHNTSATRTRTDSVQHSYDTSSSYIFPTESWVDASLNTSKHEQH